MAIEVSGKNGSTEMAASNGKANTALGLAIGGLGAAVLGGGLNGFLGNGVAPVVNGGLTRECLVDKDTFYGVLLQQSNENATRDINTERRFANLEASIAVNSTANQYQNTIIQNQFEWERVLSEKNLALATCRCIQGQVYLSPAALADSYVSPTRVLDSHEAREYLPGRPFSGGYGCNPCHGGF